MFVSIYYMWVWTWDEPVIISFTMESGKMVFQSIKPASEYSSD